MHRSAYRWILETAAGTLALLAAAMSPPALAQDAIEARLHRSGMVQVSRGGALLAMIELNAHGPGWAHAPQAGAEATITDLPQGAGKRVVGSIPIPKTDGGAIQYTQTVSALSQGFRLEYDLTIAKAMKLNGLQFSVNLPVEGCAGQDVQIVPASGETRLVPLPKEQPAAGRFQLWSGQGAKVEGAKGTPSALTVELRAATDVVVQDLRQWGQPVFEIRLPALTEEAGYELAAGERFHLDVLVTFAAPVKLAGPGE